MCLISVATQHLLGVVVGFLKELVILVNALLRTTRRQNTALC